MASAQLCASARSRLRRRSSAWRMVSACFSAPGVAGVAETSRDQEIPCKSFGDLLDLASLAQVSYIFQQNNVHRVVVSSLASLLAIRLRAYIIHHNRKKGKERCRKIETARKGSLARTGLGLLSYFMVSNSVVQ